MSSHIATWFARWGADQELEACGALILQMRPHGGRAWTDEQAAVNAVLTAAAVVLRTARRPKPPSLKEQPLAELEEIMDELHEATGSGFTASAIRSALESLND